MPRPRKIENTFAKRNDKTVYSNPEGQSKGILDDFSQREHTDLATGTIQHIPNFLKDIVNKEYVDTAISAIPILWQSVASVLSPVTDSAIELTLPHAKDLTINLEGAAGARTSKVLIQGASGPAASPLFLINQTNSGGNKTVMETKVAGSTIFNLDNEGDLEVGKSITANTMTVSGESNSGIFACNANYGMVFGTYQATNLLRGGATFGQNGDIWSTKTPLGNQDFDQVRITRVWDMSNLYNASGYSLRLTNFITNISDEDNTTGYLSAGDLFIIDKNGQVVLGGIGRVIKEFDIDVVNLAGGASGVTVTTMGNYVGNEFDIDDHVHGSFEVPYDWDSSSNIEFKIYWAIDEALGTDESVQWQIAWSACPSNETEALDAPTHTGTMDFGDQEIPASAKYLTRTNGQTISSASLSSGDLVGFTLSRIDLDDGGTNDPTKDPVAFRIEIEYTSNKLGEAI